MMEVDEGIKRGLAVGLDDESGSLVVVNREISSVYIGHLSVYARSMTLSSSRKPDIGGFRQQLSVDGVEAGEAGHDNETTHANLAQVVQVQILSARQ
ncbi:hypothetical protein ACFVJ5_35430 [Nocardia sp. NPDC127606]|uniref:hypothetical protein n=1 Tax=Nocardia sp. NPDC127606 TaxID=3345406 RepID=UPI003641C880